MLGSIPPPHSALCPCHCFMSCSLCQSISPPADRLIFMEHLFHHVTLLCAFHKLISAFSGGGDKCGGCGWGDGTAVPLGSPHLLFSSHLIIHCSRLVYPKASQKGGVSHSASELLFIFVQRDYSLKTLWFVPEMWAICNSFSGFQRDDRGPTSLVNGVLCVSRDLGRCELLRGKECLP